MARRRRIRRRRSRTRRTRRRRSRRSRARRAIKSQWGKISTAIATGVFFSQLTEKDRQAGIYSGKSMADKFKQFVNNVGGRMLGLNAFGDQTTFEQTLNPDGIFNKWTGLGVAGTIYKMLPFRGLPHRGKIGSLSKKVLVAGIAGGLFDAPEMDTRNRVQAQRPAPRLAAMGQVTTQP